VRERERERESPLKKGNNKEVGGTDLSVSGGGGGGDRQGRIPLCPFSCPRKWIKRLFLFFF